MNIGNEVTARRGGLKPALRTLTPLLQLPILLAAWTAAPAVVRAQTLFSNQGQVQVTAQRFPESLALSVTPGAISFTLPLNGISIADAPLTTTVDYVLDPASGQTFQGKVTYFFLQSDALTNSTSVIPASAFTASFQPDPGVTHPFQNLAEGGIGAQDVFSATGTGTAVSTATLHLNTTGLTLAADPYVGTLFVQAQVH